ncbi:MAG: hypothetical protein JRJ85_25200, partial [Deltaproteobacteria bacterium]|nr:hypothetical protein [Deltaproteobacteria bacterium]
MAALMRYRKPDRVPIFGMGDAFSMINCGHTLADIQRDPEKTWNAIQGTCEQYGWEPLWEHTAHTILGSWDFGARMNMPDSPYAMAVAVDVPAVETEEDVRNLKMPDPKTAGAIPQRMTFSRLQYEAGGPVTFFSRSPFVTATDICGLEPFARWLIKKPQLCNRLIRMAFDHVLNVLQYWVDTFGAQNIVYHMSSPSEANQIFSPGQIREFAIPYHLKFHRKRRAMGIDKFFFHICGEQNLNLPYLSEMAAGPDGWPNPSILSFGHEIDLEAAAGFFPEDIIMGNVNPVVFQNGTPGQVYEHCRMRIEKGKTIPGGFILAPG